MNDKGKIKIFEENLGKLSISKDTPESVISLANPVAITHETIASAA